MPPSITLDVQLNAAAVRALMEIPRDTLEGRTPIPVDIINRRSVLEKAESLSTALRSVFLNMKPINDPAAFGQLRDEVAEFGTWVKAQLDALNAAEAK
ncbi:hypothetical protein [Paraburkholderia fungorum]|uniref:Uncharacterized protein n=1 Tax=Paraburkholderia fungorum TaxID=134537 RepID=A0AAW3UZY5_9BURK|nr:hypothetical protein [Paraburkholderia fungorum]MBB4517161.1 hypothetical protein [Paraburkholderia fungorum]MBB6204229.1 hypothetical protein [Paraburkholderia fungorum]